MEFNFRQRNTETTEEILKWKFDGIYSFYNNDITQAKIDYLRESANCESCFTAHDEKGELVGHTEFYEVDDEHNLAIGVQLRPDLTGQGRGKAFVSAAMELGRQKYGFKELYIMVATFNERAIKLYKNLGFEQIDAFTSESNGRMTDFLVMKKIFE